MKERIYTRDDNHFFPLQFTEDHRGELPRRGKSKAIESFPAPVVRRHSESASSSPRSQLFTIMYDWATSRAGRVIFNPKSVASSSGSSSEQAVPKRSASEVTYERYKKLHKNKAPYCKLFEVNIGEYILTSHPRNEEIERAIIIPKGSYNFVILMNDRNELSLRIGQASHVYVAGKKVDRVVAAGEIIFEPNENGDSSSIVKLNDGSGGFHIKEIDPVVKEMKKKSFLNALKSVGLPLHKFESWEASKENENPKEQSLLVATRRRSFV